MLQKLFSHRYDWKEVAIIKATVFSFALLFVKLCPELTSLDWYWYFIVGLLGWVVSIKLALSD